MIRLKAERMRRGWSQQTLGYHSQVAGADISKVENGRLQLYPKQAERLAVVLGVKPEELLQRIAPVEVDALLQARGAR